ncbi:dUTP diphosphatase, partial [bacterium]|nr:dUTP diphosphatase [bacterium]
INFGKETICLNDAQRIAQFVVIPRPKIELNLVQDDETFRTGDRGGGIGSTGEC